VRFLLSRAWFARRQNDQVTAKADEQQAQTRLDSLRSRFPNNIKLMLQANDLLQVEIDRKISDNQPDEAIAMYRDKLANYEKIYQLEPSPDHAQLVLAGMRSLATMLLAMKQLTEAEKYYLAIEQRL